MTKTIWERYLANREAARTKDPNPTETDQASAAGTDINIIVRQQGISGAMPIHNGQPMYGDFSQLPTSLPEMIAMARSLKWKHDKLPEPLKALQLDELLQMTPEQIRAKLEPADVKPPADKPTEGEPKK